MSFHATFLLALGCILAGAGCFNANLRAQVGELHAAGDTRRADAFQVYTLAVNIAVIVAPLICGTLGQSAGYAWGFVAAGVGMAIGLVIYLAGRRWMPPEPTRRRRDRATGERVFLTPHERRTILILFLLLPPLALAFVGNQQIFNAYLLWGEAHYQLIFFGRQMPVSWLLSLDAFVSVATIFGSVLFWRWWATRHRDPDEIVKLAIGAGIAALAPLVLAAASLVAGPAGKVGLGWGVAFHVVNDIGFANIYPIALALYSRAAPPQLSATMVSVFLLSIFLGTTFDGWLGGLLATVPAAAFWALHAALVAAGALLLLAAWRLAGPMLAPRSEADR